MRFKNVAITINLFLALASVAVGQPQYNRAALTNLIERTRELSVQGHTPIIMFDLDDTLITTRERTLRILRDFAAQPKIRLGFPEEVERIESMAIPQIQFSLKDTFVRTGIKNDDLFNQADAFWKARFFSNEYCAKDIQTPGAALYLQLLVRSGAKIVYLTGRDRPRMGQGTVENLLRNRFPLDPAQAILLMKPDPQQNDLDFKKSQFPGIAALGEVIGAFENEPANINAMAEAFPNAAAIFLDTIHLSQDQLNSRVSTVPDFRL